MKKIFQSALMLLISIASAHAQTWSTPVILGTGIFDALTAQDSTVHIAYGDGTIYYRRSVNEGTTWSSPVPLGSGRLYLDRPICVDDSNVYVVYFRNFINVTDWCCPRDLGNIYMRKSINGGATWQPEIQLTTAQGGYRVAINASGSKVYLTWMDYRSGTTWDLYIRKSVDGGLTWQPEYVIVAGNNSVGAERPDLVLSGDTVHLFWMSAFDNLPPCYTMPNCSEVFYKRSTDAGVTWGADTRLDSTNAYRARPMATALSSGTIIGSWEGEDGTGENEPYTLRSPDNGTTWDTVQRMRFLPGEASHQNVASGGSNVHLAWHDERNSSNTEIYYRQSNDEGVTWGAEELVSNTPGTSLVPSLGTTTNYVHALFSDDQSGSDAPWYSRRLVNTTTSTHYIPSDNIKISIYPNPANTEIKINLPAKNYFEIEIVNPLGETILKTKNQNTIDVSELSNGIYFIKAKQENNFYSQKFIKQ